MQIHPIKNVCQTFPHLKIVYLFVSSTRGSGIEDRRQDSISHTHSFVFSSAALLLVSIHMNAWVKLALLSSTLSLLTISTHSSVSSPLNEPNSLKAFPALFSCSSLNTFCFVPNSSKTELGSLRISAIFSAIFEASLIFTFSVSRAPFGPHPSLYLCSLIF